ncbi:hypothetical protein GQ55_8G008800 [Panicum hallii var. hallii]|uniref:Bifunctional inhibitor/plant lipid transfer protein/seed storage helical domain-containing protein n=2 Tax=Panicum hallii TaxID=206008 RepID=A0A2T7CJA0_9POAL|nr:hypothetical protein GQ55_8G008800 [Panicum hallii var. hallii]PVH33467.1 hypothetical protein PAHAL_8G007000 [Panicum hallii]
MSIRIAVVLAVAAAVMVAARPSEAARYTTTASGTSDADALRFPGRPGARTRSPIFPGFPGARPSPPAYGFPGAPSTRPAPPAPVPSAPVFQPPCPKAPPSGFPVVPGFPGLPGSVGDSTPSSPTDCVTPLAGLMTCGTFLTGSESETPTPQSECCSGLGAFLNTSSAAGDGDRTLRCLCPVILGDVNKMLPKPVDPVRMMYLPIACGVVLPPQVLYICFTGQQTPPLVGRIPDVWEKPSAALSP